MFQYHILFNSIYSKYHFQHRIAIKIINIFLYSTLFSPSYVFQIWYVFQTYSTSVFRIVPFEMLESPMWPVATILQSIALVDKQMNLMVIQNVKNNLFTFFLTFCLWIIRSHICNNETLGVISFMFLLQLCRAWQGGPSSLVRKPVFHSCKTYPHSSAEDFFTEVGSTLLSVLLAVSTHPSEETQSKHLLC